MPKVRSAKGKVVDFDLLKIKNQMAQKPVSIDVKAREAFIDQKQRRRIRKAAAAVPVAVDSIALKQAEPPKETKTIEPQKEAKVEPTQTAKQKVRPPKS